MEDKAAITSLCQPVNVKFLMEQPSGEMQRHRKSRTDLWRAGESMQRMRAGGMAERQRGRIWHEQSAPDER
jgi:hypothetical protein